MMKSTTRPIIAAVAVAAISCAAYLALSGGESRRAPEVTFGTISGDRITTADLRGKVVVVNFWATSCVTCVKEMPKLIERYRKHREQGFETIAVAMSYDPPNYVLHYVEKNALPFKVALDPLGAVAREFGDVQLTPTTFVIDRRGTIVKRYLGEPDFTELDALVAAKLAEPG